MTRHEHFKRWTRMNADKLARATAEFDREFIADTFYPMTKADRARWARMKRKRGRPRLGKGAKVVAVSLEKELLSRCDRLAKKKRVSRASLIARGLRAVLAAEKAG
jgi:hypothetical protein